MAIAYVSNRGSGTPTNSGSTVTLSPNATCAAGDLVILFVSSLLQTALRTVVSVADNSGGGNAWQVDEVSSAAGESIAIVSCVLAGQITSSTVITVTLSGAATGSTYHYDLEEFSGAALTSWFDVGATATGTGTALTSGTTGAAAAGDLGVAAWAMAGLESSFTAGGGYTAFGIVSGSGSAILSEFQLGVSGAQSATGTAGTAFLWAGAQGTYKALASLPFSVDQRPRRPKRVKHRRAIEAPNVANLLVTVPVSRGQSS